MGVHKDAVAAVNGLSDAFRGFGQINIPLSACVLASTGAPLAVFSDGASATPGTQITNSKTWGVRWNNHATPTAIACNVALPQDLDPLYDVQFHALVSKTGATVGDATTVTVAAYLTVPTGLHDADTNFGGASNAVVGNATAKTVTEVIRTLALADLVAPPANLALTFGPTAATLGTDDFVMHSAWLEYTRRLAA